MYYYMILVLVINFYDMEGKLAFRRELCLKVSINYVVDKHLNTRVALPKLCRKWQNGHIAFDQNKLEHKRKPIVFFECEKKTNV